MMFLHWAAVILLIVGGLNWGLVGLFDYNVVTTFLGEGTMVTQVVYVLVGASALWRLTDAFVYKK